jgi:hypothetical protein
MSSSNGCAEGTGNPIGKFTVQAVVPASGRASIKQVFVDGNWCSFICFLIS